MMSDHEKERLDFTFAALREYDLIPMHWQLRVQFEGVGKPLGTAYETVEARGDAAFGIPTLTVTVSYDWLETAHKVMDGKPLLGYGSDTGRLLCCAREERPPEGCDRLWRVRAVNLSDLHTFVNDALYCVLVELGGVRAMAHTTLVALERLHRKWTRALGVES